VKWSADPHVAAGSKKVILAALAGNSLIAVTKFIAATITGSSAMLSEGIHSLVDTGNQVLLLHGLAREQRTQFPNDFAGALGVRSDIAEHCPDLVHAGTGTEQRLPGGGGVEHRCRQRLAQLVRKTAHHFTESSSARQMRELLALRALLHFQVFAPRRIDAHADHRVARACRVCQHPAEPADPAHAALACDDQQSGVLEDVEVLHHAGATERVEGVDELAGGGGGLAQHVEQRAARGIGECLPDDVVCGEFSVRHVTTW